MNGQNLRLFIGGKCIAAATSCALHLNVQTQDASTKDTTDGWSEMVCTGASWDASVDALVVHGRELGQRSIDLDGEFEYEGIHYLPIGGLVELQPEELLQVFSVDGSTSAITFFNEDKDELLHTGTFYANEGDEAISVYACYNGLPSSAPDYLLYIKEPDAVVLADIEGMIRSGSIVDVSLSVTHGAQNRVEDVRLYEGQARITDVSISAANRQLSTYTVQLQGEGPLEPAE